MSTPQTERHWHWEFTAFNGEWGASVTVVGYDTEDDALIAARAIINRNFFVLCRVWECASCGYQNVVAQTLQDWCAKS